MPGMSVLISVDELRELPEVVLLDVRWMLGGPPGHQEYRTGHIPGAVFVDLETELAAHGEPTDGRHPLPSSADAAGRSAPLGRARRGAGRRLRRERQPGRGARLVAAALGGRARRAAARRRAGRVGHGRRATSTSTTSTPSRATSCSPAARCRRSTSTRSRGFDGVLLDARAGERYRGETEPIDPKAGHIPGAASAPTTENLAPDGRFLDPGALRERFSSLGVGDGPTGVYCGSGVTAAHEIAALAIAGFDAALYAGSWSQWSNHDELPVATGK